jgi:HTH-type transcriptional regulator/antitoxin HigA
MKPTEEQYEFAMKQVEILLPLVDDNTPLNDANVVALKHYSDIIISYEKEHYPFRI